MQKTKISTKKLLATILVAFAFGTVAYGLYINAGKNIPEMFKKKEARVAGLSMEIAPNNITTTSGNFVLNISREHRGSAASVGSGGGVVTSNPQGLFCGTNGSCGVASCASQFDPGTQVTIVAEPDSEHYFFAWQGDCVGTSQYGCTLTMDGNKNVSAIFKSKYCDSSKMAQQNPNDKMHLDSFYSSSSMGGKTEGIGSPRCPCDITNDKEDCDLGFCFKEGCYSASECYDNFTKNGVPWKKKYTLSGDGVSHGRSYTLYDNYCQSISVDESKNTLNVSTNGDGSIITRSGEINCGSKCSSQYGKNKVVTLIAARRPDAIFVGWSGDDVQSCNNNFRVNGSFECNVEMYRNKSISATFILGTSLVLDTLRVNYSNEGIVTSNPAGINCGSGNNTCNMQFEPGTIVTLNVNNAGNNYAFDSWVVSGGSDCSGANSKLPRCAIAVVGEKTVSVNYNYVGPLSCSYVKTNPASIALSADGETKTVTVIPQPSGCTTPSFWQSSIKSNADWISVSGCHGSPCVGTEVNVTAGKTNQSRTGTIEIGGTQISVTQTAGMPLPTQAYQIIDQPLIPDPFISSNATSAKPIGVGAEIAGGTGKKLDLKISAAVEANKEYDVYLAYGFDGDAGFVHFFNGTEWIRVPEQDSISKYNIKWKSGVTGNLNALVLDDYDMSKEGKGNYEVYLGISPKNDLTKYYIWRTNFNNN